MRKINQSLLFTLKDERGVTKILVALSIVVLLGFTALVVDVGAIYFEKSRLQKALDAAVLGGAQHLKVSKEQAEETAIALALENGFNVVKNDVTTGEDYIEIEKTVPKELTFARVLGFNEADIHAVARVKLVQGLVKRSGVAPIGLQDDNFEKNGPYDLNFNPGEAKKGNFGFLGIDGPGGSIVEESILNGSKTEVEEGMDVPTETGLTWGNVKKAIEERIKRDATKTHCNSPDTADNECSRVIIIPLVDSYDNLSGGGKVKIVRFAAFWIDSVQGQTIKGHFIDYVTSGTFEPGGESNIYGVKLVK
ncbi:Tad domain-containing protein [Sporosarcina sp. ACRSL]|uniref:pilus assembly protein TadG-related protein n=1 Tax=Sporosarcina sp. ACRSL TaxID=2918215 RepID=UPI001EF744A7|nr:Tad domain-containing protein [Sporosarcina sp. ACRSL]MCG7344136.1 Tad domain-containing protein [Sporosarcina sp. ACRSL]